MSIFTDARLRQVLEEIPQTQPRSLRQKADAIALYLAFTGSFEAALSIWQFLWAEVPRHAQMPSDDESVAPEALCYLTQTADFIGGEESLETRVLQNESSARCEITGDLWDFAPGTEPPPLFNIRRARVLAESPFDEPSETELEALPYLKAFFADPGVADFAVSDAHLLFADIASRHNRTEEAVAHLKIWGQMMQDLPAIAHDALALRDVAVLISEHHLEFLTQLSRSERAEIARQTIVAVRERLNQGTPQESEQTSISCGIYCSHFNVYPAFPNFETEPPTYFEDLQAPPGDYPTEVTVATPGETGSAMFHLRFAAAMPDLQRGVFAVTFPFRTTENPNRGELNARVGNVFLSSMGVSDDVGFEVPLGEYDVAATFTLGIGDKKNEEVGLRHFEVDLCFMPKGTITEFGIHFDRSWDEDT